MGKKAGHVLQRSSIAAAGLMSMALIAGSAWGQPANGPPSGSQWSEQLRLIENELHQSQWQAARHRAQLLSEDLVEHSGGSQADKRAYADEFGSMMSGPDPLPETVVLGRAAALQAIAEAVTERRDEARWHWYLAQNLLGNFLGDGGGINLASYRKSAAFLQRHYLIDGRRQYSGMPDVADPEQPGGSYGPTFREPVRTRFVYPYLPRDLRSRDRFSHVVFVQITVDATGKIVQPVVVDGGFYPGLIYRAFDALREWRYRPATLDGKPIPFRFVAPVAFTNDRAILPLAEWTAPALSLGIVSTGYALDQVAALSADLQSGALYVADADNGRVLRVDPRRGTNVFAGTTTSGFNGDEVDAVQAQLDRPSAVSYDPRTGELFVADTGNYRIRSISPKDSRLRTVAGSGIHGISRRSMPYDAHTPEAIAIGHFSGDGGPAVAAELNMPAGVCADPIGILFISDSGNHRIRAVNRGTSPVIVMGVEIEPGQIQTIAGTGTAGFAGDGGKATLAQLAFPTKLKIDAAGNLLILDTFNQRIRRIDRQSGIIRTIAQGALTGITSESAAITWSMSLIGFGISANQDIIYADRFDHTVHRLARGGDDSVLYRALPGEGDFRDVEVGARGEIFLAEKRRIDVLHLEDAGVLTYLDGGTKPLPKRASANASSEKAAE